MTTIEVFTIVFTFLLFLATALYVYFTKQALTANVIDSIMKDYARQDVFESMKRLREFKNNIDEKEKTINENRALLKPLVPRKT